MPKILRMLLVLTCAAAWSSWGDVVCTGTANSCTTASSTADPLSLANILGTTSNCGAAALDGANSVCLVSGGIIGEGSSADGFEATLAFGNSTADATATLTGTAGGATLTLGNGTAAVPALRHSSNSANTGWFYYSSDGTVYTGAGAPTFAIVADRVHLDATGVYSWTSSATDATGGSIDTGLSRSAAGVVKATAGLSGGGNVHIGAGDLTAASMTLETSTQARTVTSSYTWTNAQVAALGAVTAGDITVVTLPAKTQVLDAAIVVTGAAVGPTTVTASLGDAIGGTPFINYIVASDIKAAANTVYGDAVAERGTSIDVEFYYLPSYTATTLVTVHFISTGANLSTVTGSTGRVILTTRVLP